MAFRWTKAKNKINPKPNPKLTLETARWKTTEYQLKMNFCSHSNIILKKKKRKRNHLMHSVIQTQLLQRSQLHAAVCQISWTAEEAMKIEKCLPHVTLYKSNSCGWHLMLPEMLGDHKEQESRPGLEGKMVTQHYQSLWSCEKPCCCSTGCYI